jgi:DNA-binding transcriptional regulator YhcF (GntR family)
MSAPPDNSRRLGTPAPDARKTWVQTERKAHEAWSKLTMESPRAGAVMHRLVALMGHQNAVMISLKALAKLMGCNERTVRRAISDLEKGNWIQVVQLGQSGTVNAYVVNDRVAWGEKREHLPTLSVFSARIVADAADQSEQTLDKAPLRRLPIIVPPEEAIPHGEGEPGVQIALPGFEAVIPAGREDSEP